MSCFLISRTVFLYCSLRKPTMGPPAFPLNMQFSSTQHSISLLMSSLIREEENLVTLLMFNLCQNCRPGCGADFCKKLIVHCRSTEKFLTSSLRRKTKQPVLIFSPRHFSHLVSCIWKLDAVSEEEWGWGPV